MTQFLSTGTSLRFLIVDNVYTAFLFIKFHVDTKLALSHKNVHAKVTHLNL